MPSPARTFTRADLATLTIGEYADLPLADKRAYDDALIAAWVENTARDDACYLSGDYDLIGSHRRFELGE